MPYKKNAPRRRNYRKANQNGYQMYKQIAPYLPKSEMKQKLTQTAGLLLTTGTSYVLLNGLFQGDDKDNRVGREVTMSSIQWSQKLTHNQSSAFATTVRCAIVIDRQPNAAVFNSSDVFGPTFDSLSLRDIDHVDRFKVLKDYRITLTPGILEQSVRSYYLKIPKYLQKVSYDVTTTDVISAITTNSLYLIMCADRASVVVALTDIKFNYSDA